jgi:hypothetical protein
VITSPRQWMDASAMNMTDRVGDLVGLLLVEVA